MICYFSSGDESGAEQQFRHQIERLREKVKVRKAVDAGNKSRIHRHFMTNVSRSGRKQ
jgi:hypothetical protein